MSWAPKEVCGVIKGDCSGNVFTNGVHTARAHVDVVDCAKHSPPYPPIATGSATVFINGQPAARVNDKVGCSAVITSGSNNVYIGGGTMQTDVLQPEKLVPDAVHAGLLVVGIGSAIVLGGPIIATAGLMGGTLGQYGGEWIGGKVFGIGSDGQKWAMLGGSLFGGAASAKGSSILAGKRIPQSFLPKQRIAKEELYDANKIPLAKDADFVGPMKPENWDALTSHPDGHAISVHGGGVTNAALITRARTGIKPNGQTGPIPPLSSAFYSDGLLISTDQAIRTSGGLPNAIARQPGQTVVRVETQDVGNLGVDLGYGYKRIGATSNVKVNSTTLGPLLRIDNLRSAQGIYEFNVATGNWETITVYPAPH
ncbi:hypothetical protein ASE07_26285 [Noviherbaspirillum sp. Root189]|nr:hypothetical protein ASE07_26285 [Noviherbaspirillum sp. Root189]